MKYGAERGGEPTRCRAGPLLVETEPGVRQLLRTHLELAGFHLEEATDGRVALERLRSVPYDVIILEVTVPQLDGVTLCRAARTGGPNGNAGILMLSAATPNRSGCSA